VPPHLFELPTALLEYLNLLQGGCSPRAPLSCYTYMIMIIKMIEIYKIAAQPAYCIETIAPHTPLTYVFSSEKKMLHYQLCSTRYVANQQLFKKKFCNQSSHYGQYGSHHAKSTL